MGVSPPPGPVQLLTPQGERVAHPEYDVDLDDAELRGLYRDMALVRRFDGEAQTLQRQGQLGLWASSLGQEAAQIGSARALRRQDYAFPTYRDHGVTWSRGVDPVLLLGQYRGVTLGGWDPNVYRCALHTLVIGSHALHATGYAMGIAKDGALGEDGEAVIAYFGDGATSQGDVNEAFVFAGVYQAPIVFFCENNGWAISVPTERQSRVPLAARSHGFGFPGVQVDGNDVLACYAVTRSAIDAARTGQGPLLVEALTYRMAPHTTSDDPSRYRLEAELEAWKLRDPIARLKTFLERQQIADADFFASVHEEGEQLADRVRTACYALTDPPPHAMFDHVYADPSKPLEAEREAHAAYLADLDALTDAALDGPVVP